MFHLSCTAVKVVFGFGYFTYKYLNGDSKFRRKHLGWWSRGDFLRRRPISHQLGNHLPGDNDDDDIYIMMHVCLFVCHEKSSLPLQVCDFLSENVWVKIFFLNFFFKFFFENFFLKIFFLNFFFEIFFEIFF